MLLNEYQREAMKYRLGSADWLYAYLGLIGEVGELYSHLAKAKRDGYEPDLKTIMKELGDVLWFVAAIADDWDIDLETIADMNIEKLASRAARNVIKGSGDDR